MNNNVFYLALTFSINKNREIRCRTLTLTLPLLITFWTFVSLPPWILRLIPGFSQTQNPVQKKNRIIQVRSSLFSLRWVSPPPLFFFSLLHLGETLDPLGWWTCPYYLHLSNKNRWSFPRSPCRFRWWPWPSYLHLQNKGRLGVPSPDPLTVFDDGLVLTVFTVTVQQRSSRGYPRVPCCQIHRYTDVVR